MSSSKKNKNNYSKQNNNNKIEKVDNKNNVFIIVILLVVLLAFLLFGILKISSSNNNNIMKQFEEKYNSNTMQILFYNDSKNNDDATDLERSYLIQLGKDYNIDFFDLDISKLSKKDKEEIDNKLGVSGEIPSIIIVKDKKIVAVQEGFIESHNLVSLLIKLKLLDKDSKYKNIDNLTFIDYDKYNEIIKSKDNAIIVVGKAACKYCESIKPIFNNISKAYKTDIYYLDLSDLKQESATKFFEEIVKQGYEDEELKEEGMFNTPTVLVVKKGKIDSYIQNARTLEEYIEYLKENKMIK